MRGTHGQESSLVEILDFQGLIREVLGGIQGSTEVWDTSHGVQGGLGRPKKLRSEPLVSYSNDFLSKKQVSTKHA